MVVKKDDVIQLELPEKGDKLLSQDLYVFQWNKGQKLEILNVPDGTEVQFGNDMVEQTLNRIKTDGFVEIPDIMLTYAEPVNAYVQYINSNSETTRIQIIIKVVERPMPGDYVYPDDEQSFREQMEQIMLDTKKIAQNALDKANDVEKRANDGEFNGKDYIITEEDKEEIENAIVSEVDTDLTSQINHAKSEIDNISKENIDKINIVSTSNIDNINNATNQNIDNINNIANIAVGTNIPNAERAAILNIGNVKTDTLNAMAERESIAINNISKKENQAISNLANQENILASNLNTDANNHIKNIDNKANEKIEEINNSATGKVDKEEFNEEITRIDKEKQDLLTDADKQNIAESIILDSTPFPNKVWSSDYTNSFIGNYCYSKNESDNQFKEKENKSNWELIREVEVTEEIGAIEITKDEEGNVFEYDDIMVIANGIKGTNGANWWVSVKTTANTSSSGLVQAGNANAMSSSTARIIQTKIERMFGLNRYEYESSHKNTGTYVSTVNKGTLTTNFNLEESTKINYVRIHFSTNNVIRAGTVLAYGRKRR